MPGQSSPARLPAQGDYRDSQAVCPDRCRDAEHIRHDTQPQTQQGHLGRRLGQLHLDVGVQVRTIRSGACQDRPLVCEFEGLLGLRQ